MGQITQLEFVSLLCLTVFVLTPFQIISWTARIRIIIVRSIFLSKVVTEKYPTNAIFGFDRHLNCCSACVAQNYFFFSCFEWLDAV